MMTNNRQLWPWEKIIRHIVSGLILLTTLYLAVMDKTASATVMAALFVVTHLLTNLDRLKSFAAFGVTAELREVIKEAQLTIEQARKMALVSASQTFYQYAIQGRLMGADWGRKNELIQKLNANLDEIGVDAAEVKEARREIFEFAQYDIISNIQHRINMRLQELSIAPKDFPPLVSWAGEDITGFDKVEMLIQGDSRLPAEAKKQLIKGVQEGRVAIQKSIEVGSFTKEALDLLHDKYL